VPVVYLYDTVFGGTGVVDRMQAQALLLVWC